MGDFAAGKILVNGVEFAPVLEGDDFEQFKNDIESAQAFAESVAQFPPEPAGDDADGMPKMLSCTVAGTAAALLPCVKSWRDAGVSIMVINTSYLLLRAAEVYTAEGPDGLLVIGVDANNSPLFMDPGSGLLSDETQPLGLNLAHALGDTRDKAIAKKIEWTEMDGDFPGEWTEAC